MNVHAFLRRATFAGATFALIATSTSSYAAGPFSSFEGNWTGTGTVSADNGSKERLRCRAHYDVGGGGNSIHG